VHPVEQFRQALAQLDHYPPGVVRVPQPVDGTAFFAAGPGLYCEQPPSIGGLPEFPFGKTMLVGNNLDAEGPYRERLESGIAHGDPRHPMRTWRGLYRLLDAADIKPEGCFFTNAYVGLIEGDKPTGKFPGASDATFSEWCESFLRFQITVMQPTVIATIGADARRFMGRLTPELNAWTSRPSMSITPAEIAGHKFSAVALAHPSMYPASARSRVFGEARGVDADAALLRAAHKR
jgi:Uracil DNA glycosylase superfamily